MPLTNNLNKDTFCIMPWLSINTTASGMARLCCLSSAAPDGGVITSPDGEPLNLSSSTPDEILNSDYLKKIRLAMLDDKVLPQCTTCLTKESYGKSSRRTYGNKHFSFMLTKETAREKTAPDGTIEAAGVYWDLRFGNLCNLKCITCHPVSSNQWYNNFVAINNDNPEFTDNTRVIQLVKNEKGRYIDRGEFDWWKSEKFWQVLEDSIPVISHIYFTGGEPLLIEPHYAFLEKLIASGRADKVILEYDTNLMAVKSSLQHIWSHFKKVRLSVSLDDFGEQNEYVRLNSNWNMIVKNVDKVKSWNLPRLELSFSITWQILNSYTFKNVLEYINDPNTLHVRMLNHPHWLNVRILPDAIKKDLVDRYEAWLTMFPAFRKCIVHLIALLQDPQHKVDTTQLSLFFKNIKILDKENETDWAVTFPELYGAIKSYE